MLSQGIIGRKFKKLSSKTTRNANLWRQFLQLCMFEICLFLIPAPKALSSNLWSTDGLTVLARIEIVTILVYYQPSFNTHTHNETQWLTVACRCHFALRDISCRQSWHLLTPSQSDHTVGKSSADAGSLCSALTKVLTWKNLTVLPNKSRVIHFRVFLGAQHSYEVITTNFVSIDSKYCLMAPIGSGT